MNKSIERTSALLNFAPQVGGVFSLQELSSLFNESNKQALWNIVKRFETADLLTRYCRGIYITKNFDANILAAKVRGDSYISFGSALAYRKVIGTESPFLVSSVVLSKAAEYSGTVGLSFSKISCELFFGFEILSNGVKMADAEKAVLDTLYFHQHKKEFYFNIFQDINFSILDKAKIESYITRYRNPKFQSFARNLVYDKL